MCLNYGLVDKLTHSLLVSVDESVIMHAIFGECRRAVSFHLL